MAILASEINGVQSMQRASVQRQAALRYGQDPVSCCNMPAGFAGLMKCLSGFSGSRVAPRKVAVKEIECATEMGLDAHSSVQVSSEYFLTASNWAAHSYHSPAGTAIFANQCCWTGMHKSCLHY